MIDADTVFLKKIPITSNKKQILHAWFTTYHSKQDDIGVYLELFKYKNVRIKSISFIVHMMMFNRVFLHEMKQEIELKNNNNWIDALMKNVSNGGKYENFSEFEIYGNWMLQNKKPIFFLIKNIPESDPSIEVGQVSELSKKYPDLHTISFHNKYGK